MSIHIIIDGYNFIRQSTDLSVLDQQDIQLGRQALVDALAAYKKIKPHRMTVVFDGASAPSFSPHRDQQKGIAIKFSRQGQSADAVIKNMARREKEKALVVSSDRDILNAVTAAGAAAISAQGFEQKIVTAIYMDGTRMVEDETQGWTPTTKKKGPRHRLSRRQRRNRIKIRKL